MADKDRHLSSLRIIPDRKVIGLYTLDVFSSNRNKKGDEIIPNLSSEGVCDEIAKILDKYEDARQEEREDENGEKSR